MTDLSQAVPKHARPNFNIPIAQQLKCHYHDPDRGNMLVCKQRKYQHLSKQAPPHLPIIENAIYIENIACAKTKHWPLVHLMEMTGDRASPHGDLHDVAYR